MAKATGKSDLISKLKKKGVSKAHRAHKDDGVRMPGGGGELPGGIEGGVAQLVQAELSEHDDGDNKGEPYAFFSGVVKEPENYNGTRCRGRRASLFIPLYDTPNRKRATFEDHWADFLNELKKFGVDIDFEPEDTEGVLEELVEEEPHFKFRSWQGQATEQYPNPRINVDFMGVVEDYEDTGETDSEGVIVEDEDAEESEEEEEETEDAEDEKEEGPVSLGEEAEEGNKKAQKELTSLGNKYGLEESEYETWGEFSDAIAGAINEKEQSEDEEEEDEEEEEEEGEEGEAPAPEVGDVKVYDGSDVEVIKVYEKKQTADVQDIETEKVYKGVAWSELSDE